MMLLSTLGKSLSGIHSNNFGFSFLRWTKLLIHLELWAWCNMSICLCVFFPPFLRVVVICPPCAVILWPAVSEGLYMAGLEIAAVEVCWLLYWIMVALLEMACWKILLQKVLFWLFFWIPTWSWNQFFSLLKLNVGAHTLKLPFELEC